MQAASLGDALAAVWDQTYALTLARLDPLERAAMCLLGGSIAAADRKAAATDAHKLAGSLGTFGLQEGTELARAAELLLVGTEPPSAAQGLRLSEIAVALRDLIERRAPAQPAGATPAPQPLLIIVEADPAQRRALRAEGLRNGWRVETHERYGAGPDGPATFPAGSAAIVDLDGAGAHTAVESLTGQGLVVVALASATELADRLEAARLGAAALIRKPVAVAQVLGTLRRATSLSPAGTHVVVLDDDPAILELLSQLLQAEHLSVTTLDRSDLLLATLGAHRPDLLILDLDMPGVGGLEWCRVLRSDPTWARLPIIVLTASQQRDVVLEIFRAGADDYVAKPFVGLELMARLRTRLAHESIAEPDREIDAVSGVSSHTCAVRELEEAAQHCLAAGQPISLALVDLTGLDRLNTRRGHAAGDRAIRSTADRLRRFVPEAVLGRWDGDELLVGAPGMSESQLEGLLAGAVEQDRASAPSESVWTAGVALVRDGDVDRALVIAARARRSLPTADRSQVAGGASLQGALDVLVADDDETLGPVLVDALSSQQMSCLWLHDGEDVARYLRAGQPPRVVLLDVGLPGLDGLSLLQQMKDEGLLARTKVVMLTVRSGETEVLQALELGAQDHIAKPFSVPVLLRRVRHVLEQP